MIFRNILLPIVAIAGAIFAAKTVYSSNQPVKPAPGIATPPTAPFAGRISAPGIVEPRSEDVAIGTSIAGIVTDVYVKEGERVEAGAPLFRIDSREIDAKLEVRRVAVRAAEAELARLEASPRAEELPPLVAQVAQEEARLQDARQQLDIVRRVKDPRAISRDLLDQRTAAVEIAQAAVKRANDQLALVEAGAWRPDLDVARVRIEQAKADLAEIESTLDRLSVRAPLDATALQVNIRVGEYANVGTVNPPLVLLGDIDILHARADIDEYDAWRFDPSKSAVATLRGTPDTRVELTFVRVEPYVVPKRNLNGDSTERVDTRVLQAIYSFDPATFPAHVGQQLDVFIEAKKRPIPSIIGEGK